MNKEKENKKRKRKDKFLEENTLHKIAFEWTIPVEQYKSKTIIIPKHLHDLIKEPNMTYSQLETWITLLSLSQTFNRNQKLKTGTVKSKIEIEFTDKEFIKRLKAIKNGEYKISVVDENGNFLNEDEIGVKRNN